LVKLAFFNGTRWVIIPDSSLGTGGAVSGRTTHLTEFRVVIAAPITNLSQATVYPNPYRPSVAAQLVQGITIDQVPANTVIKIYTIGGELVKQFNVGATGTVVWNAKNEDGQDVASGVYYALLNGGGETKTVKIAVQR
jgi:flagellar hook assembly protein FlgD